MSYSVPKDCQTIVNEIVDQALKNQLQINTNKQYDKSISLNNMKVRMDAEYRGLQEDLRQKALKLSLDGGMTPGGRLSLKEMELDSLVKQQLTRSGRPHAGTDGLQHGDGGHQARQTAVADRRDDREHGGGHCRCTRNQRHQ